MDADKSKELKLLLRDYLERHPRREDLLLKRAPRHPRDSLSFIGTGLGDLKHELGAIVTSNWREHQARKDNRVLPKNIVPKGHEALTPELKDLWFARVSELIKQGWEEHEKLLSVKHAEKNTTDLGDLTVQIAKGSALEALERYIDKASTLPNAAVERLKDLESSYPAEKRTRQTARSI